MPTRWRKRRQWEKRWRGSRQPKWLEDGPRAQVRDARESGWLPADASVVDLGCGTGNTAAWLAELGHPVFAVDISAAVIKRARQLNRGIPGLTFERADVSRPIDAPQRYDVLLDLGCLHQLPEPMHEGYAANVARLTAPGSRCLYLLRTRGADTTEGMAEFVQRVLGPEFDLQHAAPTEMQASHVEKVRPGVELRLVRR